MIAFIPSLSDCKFNALEFFTFLLSRSSLNSLAFSTTLSILNLLTIRRFTGVVAARIEQVCVELILEQLGYRISSHERSTSFGRPHLRLRSA